MADSDVPITAGAGTKIDTRTVGAGADEHRQVVVIGDPSTAGGVAPVDATAGLKVDSELEPAAALADASANPTTPRVGAGVMVWNGTGWDRARGDTANGLDVDVTRVQGVVTVEGNQPASTTGTITTATSTVTLTDATNLNVVTVSTKGTYAGVSFVVEGSDDAGTTWYPLQVVDNNTGQVLQTITPGSNATASYDVTVGGYDQFRVRATAWTSGTATIRITPQSMPYEVSPATILRPVQAIGRYKVSLISGIYAGLSAAAPVFSMRWGDATRLCLVHRVTVSVIATAPTTTAGTVDRELVVARSFTVSDSAGTAATLTGNNAKLRTSYPTSLMTDMRISSTAALTAGTRTLDTQGIGVAATWSDLSTAATVAAAGTTFPFLTIIPTTELYTEEKNKHPVVLAQNEGLIIRMINAQPAGSSLRTIVEVEWSETNAY